MFIELFGTVDHDDDGNVTDVNFTTNGAHICTVDVEVYSDSYAVCGVEWVEPEYEGATRESKMYDEVMNYMENNKR